MNNAKQRVQYFFDKPLVQGALLLVILISSAAVFVEFFYHGIVDAYPTLFRLVEYIVLPIFTVEYILQLWAAPKRFAFARKPMHVIDLLAIVPSYIEILLSVTPAASTLRVLRLVRLLRFTRLIRLFKLFRYKAFVNDVFHYNDTILQSITPIVLVLGLLKIGVIFLERHGWWIQNTSLEELFAIIGFALGIILSQKVGTTHDKFTQVEEATIRIYSTLTTLNTIKPQTVYSQWAAHFLAVLDHTGTSSRAALTQETARIFQSVRELEPDPSDLTILYNNFIQDMHFCLGKSQRLTPKAYDTLLHQSTVLYLLLIAVFLPGITGLISVLIATYILYGMYRVTQDLDSIVGGEYKLINIHLTELRQLADSEAH